ncbi:MAG: MgtC/SapB family protein [Caldilineaceae bacterium]
MPVPVRYAKGMTNLHLLALIAFAMFLGALIGFERELADKPTGLRTHMLVAGGASCWLASAIRWINFFAIEGSGRTPGRPHSPHRSSHYRHQFSGRRNHSAAQG